jgi:hypothetical protein
MANKFTRYTTTFIASPSVLKTATETRTIADTAAKNSVELDLLIKYQFVFEHIQQVAARGVYELNTNDVAVADIAEFTAYAARWGYTVTALPQTTTTSTVSSNTVSTGKGLTPVLILTTTPAVNTVNISWKKPTAPQLDKIQAALAAANANNASQFQG